jgi:hypothetical protein
MNTIYDNTFTIGQTSGINFEAGPGISITQPSEGTVRISNDETVLYSGSSANPTLSESIDNFEHIKVTYTYWPDNYATKVVYGWSAKPTFTDGWFNANGGIGGIFITRLTANDSHTNIGADANKYWNPPTGTSLNDALSNFKVLEVIGINRIGGNA